LQNSLLFQAIILNVDKAISGPHELAEIWLSRVR